MTEETLENKLSNIEALLEDMRGTCAALSRRCSTLEMALVTQAAVAANGGAIMTPNEAIPIPQLGGDDGYVYFEFISSTDPVTQQTTGEFVHCAVQVGANAYGDDEITGRELDPVADGRYFVEVDFSASSVAVSIVTGDSIQQGYDPDTQLMHVYIGTITDGSFSGVHMPVTIATYV